MSSTQVDFTKVARRPSERLAVVEHVLNTAGLQENEHLEWKSGYDMSTAPGRAKTAKQLIGFGNREPSRAARAIEGHAYLLLGVEPGRLHGVPTRWDSADIENWIAPLMNPELVYDIYYVSIQSKHVLMFVIGPPKQGDPIFCLQQTTTDGKKTLKEGTIWVRHSGKTEEATPADIAMLGARAGRPTDTALALVLVADSSRLIVPGEEVFSDDFRDRYLDQARKRMLSRVPTSPSGIFPAVVNPYGETRQPEQFVREVDRFIREAKGNWLAFALFEIVKANSPSLELSVVNSTDENFEEVVVEVTLPLPRWVVSLGAEEARKQLAPPEAPAKWGTSISNRLSSSVPVFPTKSDPVIEEVDERATRVRYPPRHVYPQDTVDLPPLLLALPPQYAGTSLQLEWRAMARNTKGNAPGAVDVVLPAAVSVADDGQAAQGASS